VLEGKTNDAGQLTGTGLHAGDRVENLTVDIFDCSPVARFAPRGPLLAPPGLVTVSQKQTPPPTPSTPPLRSGERPGPRTLVVHKPVFHVFASLTPGAQEKTAELRVWAESLDGKRLQLKKAPAVNAKLGARTERLKTPLRYDAETRAYASVLTGLP